VSRGSSIADTGVRGQGFGLTTGGGGGSGSTLDVDNFCCPDYIQLMIQQIHANWDYRVEVPGMTVVKFTIQRDGRITDIALTRSSGYTAHDINAQRALARTRQLAPLPAQFSNPTLGVQLSFDYKR
jgi:TonB family protein